MDGRALYQPRQTMTLLYCCHAALLLRATCGSVWRPTLEPDPLYLVEGDAVADAIVEPRGLG